MQAPKQLSFDGVAVRMSESRAVMGELAAGDVAREIRACLQHQPDVRMNFATAPSQAEMLAALCEESDIDWRASRRFTWMISGPAC